MKNRIIGLASGAVWLVLVTAGFVTLSLAMFAVSMLVDAPSIPNWPQRRGLKSIRSRIASVRLRMAGEGAATQAIAASLNLSEGTVRNYLSEAISKLGTGNRIEAARLARAKGWL